MPAEVRILYIEDDESLGILFTKIVTDLGHSVDVATNGHDGIAMYNADPHDVVFLDYNLPDTDGISIARKLFLDDPEQLIVLVTGEGSERLASEALSLGVTEYVVKDSDLVFTELIPSILIKLGRIISGERKKRAAEKKVNRLEAVGENSLDIIYVLDQTGMINYVSPSVQTILGYSIDDRLESSSFDLIHPDDRPQVLETFTSIVNEPLSTGTAEYRFKHKNGNWIHLESSARNHIGDPLIKGVVVHTRDITERVKSNEDYGSIIETSRQGFWRITADAVTTEVNDAMCEMLGYQRHEMLGESIFKFVDNENKKIFEQIDQHRLTEKTRRYEISLRSKLGKNVSTEFNATTLYGSDSSAAGAVAFVTNLSDHKKLLHEVEASNSKYQTLVDGSLQGVVIHRSGEILFCNHALAEIFGYASIEEVMTLRKVSCFVGAAKQDEILQREQARLNGEHVTPQMEYEGIRKDGQKNWIQSFSQTVDWEGLPAVQSTIVDVTERVRDQKKYQSIVDSSLQGIVIHRDWRIIFANSAYANMLGFSSPEQLIDTDFLSLIAAEDRIRLRVLGEQRMAGEDVENQYVSSAIAKDGSIVWLESIVCIVEWDGLPATQATVIDFTERKEAEDKLLEREALFSSTFYANPSVCTITRLEDGIYLDVNKAFEVLSGYDREELVGKSTAEPQYPTLFITPTLSTVSEECLV
jgi:PAS domain S-box-containing protein